MSWLISNCLSFGQYFSIFIRFRWNSQMKVYNEKTDVVSAVVGIP